MGILNVNELPGKQFIKPIENPTIETNKEEKKQLTKENILDIIDEALSDKGFLFDVPIKVKENTLVFTMKPLELLDSLKIQREIHKKYGSIRLQDFFTNYEKYQKSVAEKTLTDDEAYKFMDSFEVFREYAADYIIKSTIKISNWDVKEFFKDNEVFRFFITKIGDGFWELFRAAFEKNNEYAEAMEKSKKS